ncbi:MAG: hypothetical protein VX589_08040 [Myxococcota bacterium]|nr:hypothetical protein [Myxococcota bacterium]
MVNRKPETAIDFFCEGFARAVAEGVPHRSLLASTAYFATKMGGPALTENMTKWTKATEGALLKEIQTNGNPAICRRFKAYLQHSNALSNQAAKREYAIERAELPSQVKNACAVLETCCKALREEPGTARRECFKYLQAAREVDQPSWCRESLNVFRPQCTKRLGAEAPKAQATPPSRLR